MVEDAVHAGEEEPIDERLYFGQRLGEMLRDPGTGLGGHMRLARDMRRRRGELGDEYVPVSLAEHLRLRDVRQGVEIQPVHGRAVRLVARLHAARVAPFDPLRKHLLHHQVVQRLAVVALHARHLFRIALPAEHVPLVHEVVAAPRLEHGRQLGAPARREILVAVVVEMFRQRGARLVEHLELLEERIHRAGRERVHHRPAPAKPGALHLLARQLRHEPPVLVRHQLPAPLLLLEPRPAEAPAAAHRQVHAQPVPRADALGERESIHPFWRKVLLPLRLVALRAVDGDHVESAEALVGEFPALGLQSFLVYGRSHPPVVDPRPHFARRLGPRRCGANRSLPRRQEQQDAKNCSSKRHRIRLRFAIGEIVAHSLRSRQSGKHLRTLPHPLF